MRQKLSILVVLVSLTLLAACSDDPQPAAPAAPNTVATIHGTAAWDWSQMPHEQYFQAVDAGPEGFVLGGAGRLAMVSGDGRNWVTLSYDGVGDHLAALLAGDRAVFVGYGPDADVHGASSSSSSPTGQLRELRDLAFSGERIVAVGDDGEILTSADGSRWERRPADIEANLLAVAWLGSEFLAAADDGSMYASADGAEWSRVPSPGKAAITDLGAQDLDVLAVDEGGAVWRRRDGKWSLQFRTAGAALRGLAIEQGTVVAVGDGAAIVRHTEADGWTEVRLDRDVDLWDVAAHEGFVAIDSGATLLFSPDGIDWEVRPVFAPQDIADVATHEQEQLAVGRRGLYYRELGEPWQWLYEDPSLGANAALWADGRYTVACAGGLFLFTDEEGWHSLLLPGEADLWSLHWTGTELIVGGDGGALWMTADYEKWERVALPVPGAVFALAQSEERLVAVTTSGEIFTSPDARRWALRYEGERIPDAVWTGEQFLAIESGAVHRSVDGLDWGSKSEVTDGVFCALAHDGRRAYAACYDGRIYVSEDLQQWRLEESGLGRVEFFGSHLLAMNRIRCHGEEVFIAADAGLVLQRRR